jgi:hypothetical protein
VLAWPNPLPGLLLYERYGDPRPVSTRIESPPGTFLDRGVQPDASMRSTSGKVLVKGHQNEFGVSADS